MNIRLLPISLTDASTIAKWKADKELSKLILSHFSPITANEAELWITKNTLDPNQRLFGIYVYGRLLIGIARLMFIDIDARTAELGIYIGNNEYRGLGLGKTALKNLLNMAFQELNLNKIYLKVREDNLSACKLYTSLGFQIEGCLKEHFQENHVFKNHNILCMAIFNNKN